MNLNLILHYVLMLFSSVFLILSIATLISLSFVVKEIVDAGGLYGVNSGNLAGHLVILLFSMGCFYFSLKATHKTNR